MYNINNQYYGRSFVPPIYQQQYMPQQQYNYMQQPVLQQQVPQQTQQNQPIDYPISDIRFLNADQIKGFIPPIGSRVILVDRDNNIAYLETTDYMGNFTKEMYSVTKIKENNDLKQQNIDTSKFITTQDFDALKSEINDLKKQMQPIPPTEVKV